MLTCHETKHSKRFHWRLKRSVQLCIRHGSYSDIPCHIQHLHRQPSNKLYKLCNVSVLKNSNYKALLLSNIGLPHLNCDIMQHMFLPKRAKLHSGTCFNSDSRSTTGDIQPESMGSDSDTEDSFLRPALEALTPNIEPPHHVNIVPGKGPPPEPPVDCCMSGCANCVWIQYCEELKHYYSDGMGQELARKAIETIDNEGLKMFLKVELGFM